MWALRADAAEGKLCERGGNYAGGKCSEAGLQELSSSVALSKMDPGLGAF